MKPLTVLICLFAALTVFGGTSGIWYVYQPLHTLGTDQDSELIQAKFPIIANAVPEGVISYVARKNKLLQREPPFAEDSNILSCLDISVGAEWISEPSHYVVTLDLSRMKPAVPYGVTDEAVVAAAVECIKRTIDEMNQQVPWKIRIKAGKQAGSKWSRFEADHPIKSQK